MADKYQFVQNLGKGSYGAADKYRCKFSGSIGGVPISEGDYVVIKRIRLTSTNATSLSQAMREADILSKLRHPNVVAHLEHFVDNDEMCIVMEYLDGGDLQSKFMRQRAEGHSRMADEEALTTGAAIADALAYIHSRGIIHRDLKGDNILLDKFGRPRLADFGVSTTAGPDGLGHMGTVERGNVAFMSPEASMGEYSPKSDVFSLGAMLHYALSPADGPSGPRLVVLESRQQLLKAYAKPLEASWEPPPLSYEVSPLLRKAVVAMLRVNPAERPTASEVVTWLREGKEPQIEATPAAAIPIAAAISIPDGETH